MGLLLAPAKSYNIWQKSHITFQLPQCKKKNIYIYIQWVYFVVYSKTIHLFIVIWIPPKTIIYALGLRFSTRRLQSLSEWCRRSSMKSSGTISIFNTTPWSPKFSKRLNKLPPSIYNKVSGYQVNCCLPSMRSVFSGVIDPKPNLNCGNEIFIETKLILGSY